jgi:hypothetical protein
MVVRGAFSVKNVDLGSKSGDLLQLDTPPRTSQPAPILSQTQQT